jgi:stage III sporulation protein SpoIIIAA
VARTISTNSRLRSCRICASPLPPPGFSPSASPTISIACWTFCLSPVREALSVPERREQLLEVVLDLGRVPEARYPGRAVALGERPIDRSDLAAVLERLGPFGGDNRAGIECTLHRISAIRNRAGDVVGLTCRVGRAVFGTVAMVRDLLDSGQSLLMMGRPGVGKTTALREIARVLADDLERRVVVIDTSNEIAGDGDIPHPAIGRARRMQVARPELQHQVMIEAVENHMPEVIVIDEIGTELEAQAARTIAERGVMLVATAHGNELANLVKNPTLSDLVGGIQSVTLGDEEARRRRTQKTVLERAAEPTFPLAVEMRSRHRWQVHRDVAGTVDLMLRGQLARPEVRELGADGLVLTREPDSSAPSANRPHPPRAFGGRPLKVLAPKPLPDPAWCRPSMANRAWRRLWNPPPTPTPSPQFWCPPCVCMGSALGAPAPGGRPGAPVARGGGAGSGAGRCGAQPAGPAGARSGAAPPGPGPFPADPGDQIRQPAPVATGHGAPSRAPSGPSAGPSADADPAAHRLDDSHAAMEECRLAVEKVVLPQGVPVELLPRNERVRQMQEELISRYRLRSSVFGTGAHQRLRVFPA